MTASDMLAKLNSIADVAGNILEDPALPTIADRIRIIRNLEVSSASKTSTTSSSSTTASTVKGVGLQKFVKPIDAYIYYRRHPWILPVAGIGASGVLIGVGVLIGWLVTK